MNQVVTYRDREAAHEAVKHDGCALEYASEDLKADRGVVLEAVKQEGYALEYASEDLQADLGVVLEAVKQDGDALEHASDYLFNGGLKAYVQGELAAADEFAGTFLCAAALPKRLDRGAATDTHDGSPPHSQHPRLAADTTTGLEMLNAHGPHHGSQFKKRFAAFAGAPTDARLALLKAVVSELVGGCLW